MNNNAVIILAALFPVLFVIRFYLASRRQVVTVTAPRRRTAAHQVVNVTPRPAAIAAPIVAAPPAVQLDLASGLRNLGMKKADAERVAAAAVAQLPGGTIQQLLPVALRMNPKA